MRAFLSNKVIQSVLIGLGLSTTFIGLLAFAHSFAILAADKKCFPTFAHAQWPKWIGCAMAAHENLAGGLLGATGALFAAWVAFASIRMEIAENDRRNREIRAGALLAAIVAITQPIHAAATALARIRHALAANGLTAQVNADELVRLSVAQLREALNQPFVHEIASDLSATSRVAYMSIVTTLSTFLNLSENPPPHLRDARLRLNRDTLLWLRRPLGAFQPQLADVFDHDGLVTDAEKNQFPR